MLTNRKKNLVSYLIFVLVWTLDDRAKEAQTKDGVCGCPEYHEPLRQKKHQLHPLRDWTYLSAAEAAYSWVLRTDIAVRESRAMRRGFQVNIFLRSLVSNSGSNDWRGFLNTWTHMLLQCPYRKINYTRLLFLIAITLLFCKRGGLYLYLHVLRVGGLHLRCSVTSGRAAIFNAFRERH